MSYKFGFGYNYEKSEMPFSLLRGAGTIPSTFVNIIFDTQDPLSYPGTGNEITDLSINKYTGTFQGVTIDTDGTILYNSPSSEIGVYLDGPEFISGPEDQIEEITFIAWVKAFSANSGQANDSRIVFSFDRSSVFRYTLGLDSGGVAEQGKPTLAFCSTSGVPSEIGPIHDIVATQYAGDLRDDEWHQISFTFKSGEVNGLKFYVDNQVVHTEAGPFNPIGDVDPEPESPRYGWIGNGSEATTPGGTIGPVTPWYGNIGYIEFVDTVNAYYIEQNYRRYKPVYDPLTITLDSSTNPSYYSATDGEINVTVTGSIAPYTYSWSNGATTDDITGLADGTYTLTVTDDVGTQQMLEVTLTQPAYVPMTITLDSANNPSGSGTNDGSINVTVTDGVAPYSYSWSNGETTEDITGLADGTYTLTVTDDTGAQETLEVTIAYTGPLECTPQGLTWTSGIGTSNRFYQPAYGLYDYSVCMFIILASELTPGMSCINGIEYEQNGYSTPYTYFNQTIRLAHIQESFFGTAVTVGLQNITVSDDTTVKANFDYTIANSGWNSIDFDDKFEWNGVDHVLVIHENRDGNYNSGYGWGETLSQGSGINRTVFYYQDNSYPNDNQVLSVDNRRINMKLKY